MSTPNPTYLVWRKSSRSNATQANCIEIARTATWAAVRDSKNRHATPLEFDSAAFTTFLDAVKAETLS